MSRGHVNDTVMPGFAATAGVMEFSKEVLGMPATELVQRYELWETSRDKGECSGCVGLLGCWVHYADARCT